MSNQHSSHGRNRVVARESRRGTAILPALIVIVMIATLSMIYVQVSLSKNKEQRVSVDSKRAFYMAEAGLAEGFNGLCLGKSGNVASEDVPAEFGGGIFWTTAEEVGSGRVRLQATGLAGAGRATLAITCERKSDEVGSLGFFGGQNITVEAGALIDSYDSRLGTYASQSATAALAFPGARVGGNSDITVEGTISKPTLIFGDVNPGPAGTVFKPALGALITGSTAPSVAPATFPAVKPPVLPLRGNLLVSASHSLAAGAYGLGKVVVAAGKTLTLTGPMVVVADELLLNGGSKLDIDARAGPVKFYVVNAMKFPSSSLINSVSTDPRQITFQVAGTNRVDIDGDGVFDAPVSIEGTGAFYGSIYAPSATFELPRGFDIFGSVVADGLTVKAGGKLHYDRAFSNASGGTGTPQLLGWHIVELPNVPLVQLRFDALADLLKRGVIPKKAANGHFDIGIAPN